MGQPIGQQRTLRAGYNITRSLVTPTPITPTSVVRQLFVSRTPVVRQPDEIVQKVDEEGRVRRVMRLVFGSVEKKKLPVELNSELEVDYLSLVCSQIYRPQLPPS